MYEIISIYADSARLTRTAENSSDAFSIYFSEKKKSYTTAVAIFFNGESIVSYESHLLKWVEKNYVNGVYVGFFGN